MFKRFLVAAFFCATMAGCVTMPIQQNDGVSVTRVVERVKCELGQAVALSPTLKSWAGVITLTLEIDNTGSVMPSGTLIGPIGTGAYGVDIGAGVSGKSIQTSLVNVYFPVYELAAYVDKCPVNPGHPLEDQLGLREWVYRALEAKGSDGLFKDKDKAIGYTVEFDLELSGGVTPSFTFNRVSEKTGLSVSRKHVNTLEVALADANLVPPHDVLVRTEVKPRPKPENEHHFHTEGGTIVSPDQKRRKQYIEKRVPRGGRPLSDKDKDRLDNVIRQLQLKNLRLRM